MKIFTSSAGYASLLLAVCVTSFTFSSFQSSKLNSNAFVTHNSRSVTSTVFTAKNFADCNKPTQTHREARDKISLTTKEKLSKYNRAATADSNERHVMDVDSECVTAEKNNGKETFEFQAEVGRVMDIIINSLYSDKDIFLRELVSNAADACDKKRFLSITAPDKDNSIENDRPQIWIKANEDKNTLIIEDSGVGMTRDELINNLGRIAQSGTSKFLEAIGDTSKDNMNLIGQFGVGFYSSYLVANKVEVVTKSMQPQSKQLRWESDSGSSFTVFEDNDSDMDDDEKIKISGTKIILHIKENSSKYLQQYTLSELLMKYSEFIEFPIHLWKETTEYIKEIDTEASKSLKEGEEPKMKTVPKKTLGYNKLNNQKPIWLRSPKEVNQEEYEKFYKSSFRAAYDDPQKWAHFALEGSVEFKALLYIPGMLPFELSKDMFDENTRNIRLYVKRVFINDKFEGIMPRWLNFIRGVVDSNDLPLNVSREILQRSRVLNIINKKLVRKSLDMFRDLASDIDESKYNTFWNNFGKYLKVGVVEDQRNKEDIIPLLRFWSVKSGDKYTSLDAYVDEMPEGQKSIYYVSGEGKEKTKLQPVVEKLSSRGYDVLFMTEALDEITIEAVRKYKEFDIVDASKEGLDIEEKDENMKKKKKEFSEKYSKVIEYLEVELAGLVEKVVISTLLTTSPAALVQGAYGVSPSMQRYMKAQSVAAGSDAMSTNMINKAILEINPNHPILQDLENMVEKKLDDSETKIYSKLLYDVARITSGYEISDSGEFAKRIMSLMTRGRSRNTFEEAEVVNDHKNSDLKEELDKKTDGKAVKPEVIE